MKLFGKEEQNEKVASWQAIGPRADGLWGIWWARWRAGPEYKTKRFIAQPIVGGGGDEIGIRSETRNLMRDELITRYILSGKEGER